MKTFTPLDWWFLSLRYSQMMVEAQTVMSLRLLGMTGLWPVAASEQSRMVTEKLPAFIKAGGHATAAAMKGRRPDQIMDAALKPIGRKTRSNARRLSSRRRR